MHKTRSDTANFKSTHFTTENNPQNSPEEATFASYAPPEDHTREIITNRLPSSIRPGEIPTARLLIRRDRATHFQEIGEALNKLRKQGKAFDCTVICNKTRLPAHRVVLAGHSRFFGEFLYASSGTSLGVDVPVDGVVPRALEIVLKYMYNSKLSVKFDTVLELLATARCLGVVGVPEQCGDFLQLLLADGNLMTTLELAEQHHVNSLYSEAYRKLARQFYAQTKMATFLTWDIDKVCSLLENDNIIIETELHVFTAAMRWIGHNRRQRLEFFPRLMSTVRWMYMSQDEILQCIDQERELLRDELVCPNIIAANWYKTFKSFEFAWKDYVIPTPRTRAFRSEDPNDVVLRIRGQLQSRHSSFDQIWGRYEPEKTTNLNYGKSRRRPKSKPRKGTLVLTRREPDNRADGLQVRKAGPLNR